MWKQAFTASQASTICSLISLLMRGYTQTNYVYWGRGCAIAPRNQGILNQSATVPLFYLPKPLMNLETVILTERSCIDELASIA